jgi:hypothetical protein
MQREEFVVIASHLRPEEAGMLRGLLDSAGIAAVTRDEMLSGVNPFLQPIIGGAKVAVAAVDAERARDLARSAGLLAGPGPDQPIEIPEEQWSAPSVRASRERLTIAVSAPPWGRWPAVLAVAVVVLAFLRCAVGAAER